MTLIVLALLIGIVAGLRAMTAPAAAAIGAHCGMLAVAGTPLAFMGNTWTAVVLVVLALGELVTDQLPSTPSRKVPAQFGGRILTGALSGATFGAAGGSLISGAVAGIVGAIIGTLGGAAFRSRMAAAFGKDRPAALIEDAIAIAAAAVIVIAA